MNRKLIIQLALYMADRCPDKLERFARIVYDEWKESEHPRDEDGEFTEVPENSENTEENKSKELHNAKGKIIVEVTKTKLKAEPNSITQQFGAKGGINRNYYGDDGWQTKQICNHDHGNPKQHPYGKHGEHGHDYILDENHNLYSKTTRELTDEEREENADIL